MSLPRYASYKDSGVEWLGEVPEHWDVSRLGFESWVRARLGWKGLKAEEYVDEGFAFLSTPNIKGLSIDFENVNFITQERFDESPEIKVREGDVLLAKDGSTLGTVNVVRKLPRPTTVNSSIAVITPNTSLNSVFLYYLFASSYMEQTIQRTKGGMGVPHLFQADLNKFYLPLPSHDEQTHIAAFLDRETAKIDELVTEQRRLMELLKEKRQAVISHAVTQGLNPHAPMKPSGIEWLGDVPAHWECACLTRIASRIVVGIAEAATHAYADEGVPILRSTNIRPGKIIGDILFVDPAFARDRGSKQLNAGDLVSVRTGNAGVTAVIPSEFDGCQCFTMLITTLDEGSLSDYYCYWMNSISAQCYFSLEGWGTAQVNISVPILKALPVPLPPTSEQREIVSYLDRVIGEFDTLTAEAQHAIDLLQERRTALISAAVTGQIDVRQLAERQAA